MIRPSELLREKPTTTGRPIADQLVEPAHELEVVLHRLAEADPGIEADELLADPCATANASRSSRNAFTSETTSS